MAGGFPMQPKGPLRVLIKTMSLVVTILVLGVTALAGPKYKVLHALGNRTDGGALWGSLALDSKGSRTAPPAVEETAGTARFSS